ncbi:MAG: arginine--tRNA ligase [Patescibacteria group bacterium]|mgnify:CR=1 FL=1
MIKQDIQKALAGVIHELWAGSGMTETDIEVVKPNNNQADYANSSAFVLGKRLSLNLVEVASKIASALKGKISGVSKIETSGGFVNFFVTSGYLQEELLHVSQQEHYGRNDSLKGKTIMVEYTDPNPFKLFHIGHLMSNTIGESIARLYTASGAKVLRVNYQGDVGMHVAKAIWGMKKEKTLPRDLVMEKIAHAYSFGSKSYEDAEEENETKGEIQEINQKIYEKSDSEINELYQKGREGSLNYFEEMYKRLGTKFDHYFFESEVADDGLKIVRSRPDIFKESQGAVVFEGEPFGLHTRVFVNSKGLPTYEAKELGVNKKKFNEHHPDLSVIVTGNEINEYFKVLMRVMELIMPDVGSKTRHISHGMMRLPTGKMSSRTGDVVTADSLIDQTKEKLKEKENQETDDSTREAVAIGAIKYSILKQSPGKDIIFDFDKSLAVKGDSGPYLQYTYARLKAIIAKTGDTVNQKADIGKLIQESELALIKHLLEFPDVIKESSETLSPQHVALYVFELANLANNFYEKVHILKDEDPARMSARLLLIRVTTEVISHGLSVLGIKTPERI